MVNIFITINIITNSWIQIVYSKRLDTENGLEIVSHILSLLDHPRLWSQYHEKGNHHDLYGLQSSNYLSSMAMFKVILIILCSHLAKYRAHLLLINCVISFILNWLRFVFLLCLVFPSITFLTFSCSLSTFLSYCRK